MVELRKKYATFQSFEKSPAGLFDERLACVAGGISTGSEN
jgi:hypothetical protein